MSRSPDSKDLSRRRFSRFAQDYVSSQTHARGPGLERMLVMARPQPSWDVLDIATGGGHTAVAFAPYVRHVVASDLTPEMLAAASQHAHSLGLNNITFQQADAEDLPFEDGRFDLVTCRIAPHHFPHTARFVQEAARVLKKCALFLMQDHLLPDDEQAARYIDHFERLRDPSHHRAYNCGEWVEMFSAARLQIVNSYRLVKEHDFLPWAQIQRCSPDIIEQLVALVLGAPPAVVDWLQPTHFDAPEQAHFQNKHILICGRKTNA